MDRTLLTHHMLILQEPQPGVRGGSANRERLDFQGGLPEDSSTDMVPT
jgi:hypothetical protein